MFAVPSSDGPPSTPDSRRASHAPSTTPAGPPPTGYTNHSFTPAGPPPASSLFDASYKVDAFSNSRPLWDPSQLDLLPSSPPQPHRHVHGLSAMSAMNGFNGMSGMGGMNGIMDDEAYLDDDHAMFGTTQAKHALPQAQSYAEYDSPRALKRSRYNDATAANPFRSSRATHLDSRQSAIPSIAKAFTKSAPPALEESDDLILQSESLLSRLDAELRTSVSPDVDGLTQKTTQQLADLWQASVNTKSVPGGIGPKNQKSSFDKANYLASLLLRLHHPFIGISKQKTTTSSQPQFARSFMDLVLHRNDITTVPRSLLDWLNTYHNPFPEDLSEVLAHRPGPVAHEKFWDMVYAATLRGNLSMAISLLDGADFTYADTAMDDGYDEPGYHGRQAEAARYVTSRCVELLQTCPAYVDDDWDVKNGDWAIFRNRVRRELQDLEAYAESDSRDRDTTMNDGSNVFQSSAMGPARSGLSFSTASRRAESKVPWTVYQNIKILYGQLQGLKEEIAVCTQDWLETAIYLTVWWDGEDADQPSANMLASRNSLRQSQQIRPVDVSPTSSYCRQLLISFASVTDDPEDTVFAVNTLDPLQVGIACICEEDIEGVIGILRGWSLPLASAVVEIASAGGWLPQGIHGGQGILEAFDNDDLLLLSHGQEKRPDALKRDDVLAAYADRLSKEDEFASSDGKIVKEGWDLACRVLGRLDDSDAAQSSIARLLADIPLDSSERVDKVLAVCSDIGLPDQVYAIAERYADSLAKNSHSYGSALIYYARAHSQEKLKATIDRLISWCLVQSAAFPPKASLDPQLALILNDQRAAITKLAKLDQEAAQLIATYLSGYATLRKFYELRDADLDASQETDSKKDQAPRPQARRQEAAKALLALIESAADSIRGGLHDSETETVVQVDTLMALLCETLPLMDHRKQVMKTPQLLLILRAVEDLEAVTPLVYDQTESLFRSAVQNYCDSPTHLISSQDLARSVSDALLSKSVNSLAASGYDMIGSNGSLATTNGDTGDKVEVRRSWDWRAGAAHIGKNVKGEEMLRILRAQVAKEMARAWSQQM